MLSIQINDDIREQIVKSLFIACIILCVCVSAYQLLRYGTYRSIDISCFDVYGKDDYTWDVNCSERSNMYQIDGWIVKRNEDIKTRNIKLVIVNPDGSSYLVPTKMITRSDVTDYMNDGHNYNASGFSAIVNKRYVHSDKSMLYIFNGNNDSNELVNVSVTLPYAYFGGNHEEA